MKEHATGSGTRLCTTYTQLWHNLRTSEAYNSSFRDFFWGNGGAESASDRLAAMGLQVAPARVAAGLTDWRSILGPEPLGRRGAFPD